MNYEVFLKKGNKMHLDISKIIDELLETYLKRESLDAVGINNGYCEDFACELANIINTGINVKTQEHANVYWDSDYCEMDISHCFIEFNGLFYDSECNEGVLHPGDLPIYSRLQPVRL